MTYQQNRVWADQYIDQTKDILGPLLLQVSDFEVDTKQASDFVLTAGATHIACRIRKHSYFANPKYRYQFTIRGRHDNGCPSEYQKIFSEQKPDWGFYGFTDKNEKQVAEWIVWDVTEFRRALVNQKVKKPKAIPNGDGTNFLPFNIGDFPKEFVVAHSGYLSELIAA